MSVKTEKIAGIILKNVSEIIQFQLKDPKIGFVTITDVEVTNDLSIAKIYVSFLGWQKEIGSNRSLLLFMTKIKKTDMKSVFFCCFVRDAFFLLFGK